MQGALDLTATQQSQNTKRAPARFSAELESTFEDRRVTGVAQQQYDRRQVLKTVAIGGILTVVSLPRRWTKPFINAVVVPAHAAASAPPTTTTTTTTSPAI
jgi:hypothetical protein